jgi:pimeloyl-ACP methyl ester carboxylesterase
MRQIDKNMKTFLLLSTLFAVLLFVRPVGSGESGADGWTPTEMGGHEKLKGPVLNLRLLPEGHSFPAELNCDRKPTACQFELGYFLSDGFDLSNKRRLNILFIPGGPGAIVDPSNRWAVLQVLEEKHNVVYFHPRGMGKSAIDGDRRYDQFLRADYVVDDIEQIRRKVLKDRPWDAIYGHSWGTVIAQRYAAKYGQSKDAKVKSLILTGPVDRHRPNTEKARAAMIVENLKAIFTYYRSAGATCACQSTGFLKSKVVDLSSPQIFAFGARLEANDNLCFLNAKRIDNITSRLRKMLDTIDEEFGSADFIVDNFAALKKDKEFQGRFAGLPVEFFAAIRYLQMAGAPESDGLVFVADSRSRIDAALVIAHDLSSGEPGGCKPKEEIFAGASAECAYCDRLKAAREALRPRNNGDESQRGSYVFGVYDGVTRWLPVMMGAQGCFAGAEITGFDKESGKEFARAQTRKIGVVASEKICPWNPADFRHDVPTLLIKGSRDTVVAGCQTEDFLLHGLKDGRGVLLDFRGLGHDVSVGNLYEGADPSTWSRRFAALLEDFVKLSGDVSKFRSAAKAQLTKLKATDRTRDPNLSKQCGENS